MVKNIFKIYEKIIFIFKKKFCIMNKMKSLILFIIQKMFLSKTQWNLTCAEYALLFFKFYDVKTKTSMSCKELFDEKCPLVQHTKSENT